MVKKSVSNQKVKTKKSASTSLTKKSNLERKINEVVKQKETIQDQLLRTLAEMDNMKKRLEKERIIYLETANADLLRALLPIADDLERSLKNTQEGGEFQQGIEMIYQKMIKLLSDKGLVPMETIGKPFNVEMHDALMMIEKEGVDPGIVIEEHEKGYFLHGRVLRHAKVLVSK